MAILSSTHTWISVIWVWEEIYCNDNGWMERNGGSRVIKTRVFLPLFLGLWKKSTMVQPQLVQEKWFKNCCSPLPPTEMKINLPGEYVKGQIKMEQCGWQKISNDKWKLVSRWCRCHDIFRRSKLDKMNILRLFLSFWPAFFFASPWAPKLGCADGCMSAVDNNSAEVLALSSVRHKTVESTWQWQLAKRELEKVSAALPHCSLRHLNFPVEKLGPWLLCCITTEKQTTILGIVTCPSYFRYFRVPVVNCSFSLLISSIKSNKKR